MIRYFSPVTRIATQPGKPGKVRKSDISPKNHGKVREFCGFIPNPVKVREFEKNLRLGMIFMPTLKPNF